MVHHFRGELWDCNKHATGWEDGGNLNVVDRYHNGRHDGWQGTVRQGQVARRGRVGQGIMVG